MKYIKFIYFLALLLIPFLSSANSTDCTEVFISGIENTIYFNGLVEESAWKLSQDFPLKMHFPVYNNVPEEKSKVFITYDQDYLWVGAILYYNNVSNIVSSSRKRDEEASTSDEFGIILDSYNDNENALGFFTMPSGQKIDFTISNDGQQIGFTSSRNYTWNAFWDVKTQITDSAWHVEMRIPFSSLRFQSIDGVTKMGLIINRRIVHLNEIDTYPPIDTKYGAGAPSRPSLAKTIIVENSKSRNPVYIAPYVLSGLNSNYNINETGTGYTKSLDKELTGGLDVKYNLNNNLTLDFTVNTDFAQVEADDEMVNLTRYSLFLPEKRLFFQERSGVFNYSLDGPQKLFYSRNIGIVDNEPVRILGGARMIGRLGKWDLGLLSMNTVESDNFPAENFSVARLRRQVINEKTYVGGLIANRINFDGKYNVAYGLDGIFSLGKDNYLDVEIAQTAESEKENEMLSLAPSYLSVGLQKRTTSGFYYSGKYAYWGKDFNPATGFYFINNIHEARGSLNYGWFPEESSPLFHFILGVESGLLSRLEDGNIESLEIAPECILVFKSGYFIHSQIKYKEEGLLSGFKLTDEIEVPAGIYSFWNYNARFSSPRVKKFIMEGTLTVGEYYDGNQFSASVSPKYNFMSFLQISGSYQLDRINFPVRNQSFVNNIARVKAIFMFNNKLSLSSFIQYNEAENIFITNSRLRYNPRDGNDLYVVFNKLITPDKTRDYPMLTEYTGQSIIVKYTHTFKI